MRQLLKKNFVHGTRWGFATGKQLKYAKRQAEVFSKTTLQHGGSRKRQHFLKFPLADKKIKFGTKEIHLLLKRDLHGGRTSALFLHGLLSLA